MFAVDEGRVLFVGGALHPCGVNSIFGLLPDPFIVEFVKLSLRKLVSTQANYPGRRSATGYPSDRYVERRCLHLGWNFCFEHGCQRETLIIWKLDM